MELNSINWTEQISMKKKMRKEICWIPLKEVELKTSVGMELYYPLVKKEDMNEQKVTMFSSSFSRKWKSLCDSFSWYDKLLIFHLNQLFPSIQSRF